MACYAYQKVQGQLDCFAFVDKADRWFDTALRDAAPLDTWLSWCFVGPIVTHCLMVVFLSNRFVQNHPEGLGWWGEPTTTRGSCEVDYGVSHFIGELHNAYSNFLFLFVGMFSMELYRRHRLPRRMAILAGWVMLTGFSGVGLHITLHRRWELLNDISQAGVLISLYRCRGPVQYASGYRPMALRSAAHMCGAIICLVAQIEWFREIHMCVMATLILHLNYKSTRSQPQLWQRVMRATALTVGCWVCYLLDNYTCWFMQTALLNPQLLALSNLLASISVHEAVVVTAVLVAEDMGGEAELGVIGYGPGYRLSSLVGWAGISYVDDIEYGIKSVTFTKTE